MTDCKISGSISIDGEVLLENLSLDFSSGWTCLLGPSGSGKSTLLRMIGRLRTAATFDGDLTAPDHIGWMAQDDLLQARFTALENVRLMSRLSGKPIDADRAGALLDAVELSGKSEFLPEQLSGGQRQRVALARTLSEDAPLVLLDEPFSALDPITRIAMQDLAYEKLRTKTVIMVTHDPAEALRLADRILMVSNHQINEIKALPAPHPKSVADKKLALAAAKLAEEMVGLQ